MAYTKQISATLTAKMDPKDTRASIYVADAASGIDGAVVFDVTIEDTAGATYPQAIALTDGVALPAKFAGAPIAASTLTPAQQTTLRQLLAAVRAQAAAEQGFTST